MVLREVVGMQLRAEVPSVGVPMSLKVYREGTRALPGVSPTARTVTIR